MASLTVENYVKAIYLTTSGQDEQPAATGQLAEALAVSPGAVTAMVKTLAESQLASYTRYEGVSLTPTGTALALRVLRRHRLIELFLAHTLDLTWDEVHQEAEHMEHAVSDWLVDRIDAYLDHPHTDPHGDPIPGADGTVRNPTGSSLATCAPGDRFRVLRVTDQSPDFLRFLADAGMTIGAQGTLLSTEPVAGIITVELAGQATALGSDIAEKLAVEKLSESP